MSEFLNNPTLQTVLMIVGAVTIIIAVLRALVQHNLKHLLAFDDISQVGYVVLGIGTGTALGVIGGLFHMVNLAIYGTMLFLMGRVVGRASGSDDIEEMGGLARRMPITFTCSLIAAAAISGIPPFNGFVSKWLIYQSLLDLRSGLGVAMLVVAVFGSSLTLASFVKVIYSAFLSRPPAKPTGADSSGGESFWTAVPMIVLAVACVGLGLYPQVLTGNVLIPAVEPAFADGVAAGTVTGIDRELTTSVGGLWNPSVAMGLILIGIVGGLVLRGVFAVGKVRVVRPFLSGEIGTGPNGAGDDRFRILGSGFYETICRIPVLKILLKR